MSTEFPLYSKKASFPAGNMKSAFIERRGCGRKQLVGPLSYLKSVLGSLISTWMVKEVREGLSLGVILRSAQDLEPGSLPPQK